MFITVRFRIFIVPFAKNMNIKTYSTEIVPVFCMVVNPDLSY